MKPSLLLGLLSIISFSCNATTSDRCTPDEGNWKPLFNGKDLSGWQAISIKSNGTTPEKPENYFSVSDGAINVYEGREASSTQPFAAIQTEKTYSNYRLSLEYKWGEAKFAPRTELLRDAGILYHVHGFGKPNWPLSVENQIQEGEVGDFYLIGTRITVDTNINSYIESPKNSVSSYTYIPPHKGGKPLDWGEHDKILRVKIDNVHEVEGWNKVEVVARGDTSLHIVNGKINMRAENLRRWDSEKQAWSPLTNGPILLQAEGAQVSYRNVQIRDLLECDPE